MIVDGETEYKNGYIMITGRYNNNNSQHKFSIQILILLCEFYNKLINFNYYLIIFLIKIYILIKKRPILI